MTKIQKKDIQDILPLSPVQAGLLFHTIQSNQNTSYLEQVALSVNGTVDWPVFKESWGKVVQKHGVLRAVFRWKKLKQPLMVVLNDYPQDAIKMMDLSELSKEGQLRSLAEIKANELEKIKDLTQITFRVCLIKYAQEHYDILLSNHHILFDGWSRGLLLKEFALQYGDLISGHMFYQDRLLPSFKDYLAHREAWKKEQNTDFWSNYLKEYQIESLLSDYREEKETDSKLNTQEITLSQEQTTALRLLADQNRMTLSSVFYTIWGIVLQKIFDRQDVVFGVTVSGRNTGMQQMDSLVGLFINTLPLRIKTDATSKVLNTINEVQKNMQDLLSNEMDSLTEIKEAAGLLQKEALFDSLVVVENFPVDTRSINAGLDFEVSDFEEFSHTHYPLTLTVYTTPVFKITFNWDSSKLKNEKVALLASRFELVLNQILENSHQNVSSITITSNAEKQLILDKFIPDAVPVPEGDIIDLFQKMVKLHPNNMAVVGPTNQITYAQLDERSSVVATKLLASGVQQEDLVAMIMHPSTEMIVSMLGILKAKAAYLPINPKDPEDRIMHILKDSNANYTVSHQSLLGTSEGQYQHIKNHFKHNQVLFEAQKATNNIIVLHQDTKVNQHKNQLNHTVYNDRLAYVIYTSGTTGLSKGILLTMKGLVNTSVWHAKFGNITSGKAYILIAGYYFDPSIEDIFGTLISGATLHTLPHEFILQPLKVKKYLIENNINGINVTPSYLKELQLCDQKIDSLEWIIAGGENLEYSLKEEILQAGYALFNAYGPTEITVDACNWPCVKESPVYLGKPIDNAYCLVLNSKLQLCPVGVTGNLYLGGPGVARGYLNNPSLTNEKFIPNPFNAKERIYNSGDLAEWTPDGQLIFKGRKDQQVKIRGYRVELEEIENWITNSNEVLQCAVCDFKKEDGSIYLAAYLKTRDNFTVEALKKYLFSKLPAYMVPSYFIEVETLPLNANGKLDTKKLPLPNTSYEIANENPESEVELKLQRIWQQILGTQQTYYLDTDFYAAGGNSIKAMSLVAIIHKEFEVELHVNKLFEASTIRSLSKLIEESDKEQLFSIPVASHKASPVSYIVKNQYFLQQANKESTAYNMPSAHILKGNLDKLKLQKALNQVLQRNDALRSYFVEENGELKQKYLENINFSLEYLEDTNTNIDKLIQDFVKPFNLEEPLLFRARLVQTAKNTHVFLIDVHHIISDGNSQSILIKELTNFYNGSANSSKQIGFNDYAHWIASQSQKELRQSQASFWKTLLADELPVLQLPIDKLRPRHKSLQGTTLKFQLNGKVLESFRAFCQAQKVTPFMALTAVFNAFLSRLTGQEDIITGIPVSRRNHPDLAEVTGMFVNTLPLRSYPESTKSFETLLLEIKALVPKMLGHGDYPFEKMVEDKQIIRDTSRNPLFDVMFVYNETTRNTILNLQGLSAEAHPLHNGTSKFDLLLETNDFTDYLEFTWEYDTALFDVSTISNFSTLFQVLLEAVIADAKQAIGSYPFLSETDKELLSDFNKTSIEFPAYKSVIDLWNQRVQNTPEAVAIIDKGEEYSFEFIDLSIHQLAKMLRKKGVSKEQVVALSMDRSSHMFITIMAIMRAGGTYLPLATDTPIKRMSHILNQSNVKILVTTVKEHHQHFAEQLEIVAPEITIDHKEDAYENIQLPEVSSNQLAYILYTSGSTGIPKGVMITHAAMLNTLNFMQQKYPVKKGAYLFKTAFTFDVSITELFGWIFDEGRLVILEEGKEKDPQEIIQIISQENVTHINFVPAMFTAFSEFINPGNANLLNTLSYVMLAGEALFNHQLTHFRKLLPAVALENLYGPTEAAIYASYYSIPSNPVTPAIPIGKPIDNVQIYITDNSLKEVPVGVWGELCIAGKGLSRGYLTEDITAKQKFCKLPETTIDIFRTNDVARWTREGNLEFKGRSDDQVKVRGFRIEPREVEIALMKHHAITKAVVCAERNHLEAYKLIAYINTGEETTYAAIQQHLKKEIPAYMLPSAIRIIEEFPTTSSGKINKTVLAGKGTELKPEVMLAEANTALEKEVLAVWEQVLGLENLGIHDNFFDAGGDSIKALRMVSRLNNKSYEVRVRDVFTFPTVAELTAVLGEKKQHENQKEVAGLYPLTPIQNWFFRKELTTKNFFNQAVLLAVKQEVSKSGLTEIINQLMAHHDVLRSRFVTQEQIVYQEVQEPASFHIQVQEFFQKDKNEPLNNFIKEQCDNLSGSLDIETGELFKVALFHTSKGDYIFITVHHLVIDVVSWKILLEDLQTLYRQKNTNTVYKLPYKTTSYGAWALLQNKPQIKNIFENDINYWNNALLKTVSSLPLDFKEGANKVSDAVTLNLELTEEESKRFFANASVPYQTQTQELILAAICNSFKDWRHSGTLLMAIEGHGRDPQLKEPDFNRTIGWFTALYPVIFQLKEEDNSTYGIPHIKETIRKIPRGGIGYGVLNDHNLLQLPQNYLDKASVLFNFHGSLDKDWEENDFELVENLDFKDQHENEERPFPIEIEGAIKKGKLSLQITYSKQQFAADSMNQLVNLIRAYLGKITAFCEENTRKIATPSDYTYKNTSFKELETLKSTYDLEDILPLTPMKSGLLFRSLVQETASEYFEQAAFQINGEIDLTVFKQSLLYLFNRHDILRSVFITKGLANPVQVVLSEIIPDFSYNDISSLEEADKAAYILAFQEEERNKGFTLSKAGLCKVTLFKLSPYNYEIVWSFHHILMDGWSLGILQKDFYEIYASIHTNQPLALGRVPSYKNYINWYRNVSHTDAKAYWTNYLKGFEAKTTVAANLNVTNAGQQQIKSLKFDEAYLSRIKTYCTKHNSTLNSFIQTVWGIVLAKLNNTRDVIYGTVVSGRSAEVQGIEQMVNLFINTIPVRINYDENTSVGQLLEGVQNKALKSEEYHYLSLAEVQSYSQIKGDLFDHILVFENYHIEQTLENLVEEKAISTKGGKWQLQPKDSYEKNQYNFSLNILPGNTLTIDFKYNSNYYSEGYIENIRDYFKNVSNQLLEKGSNKVKDIYLDTTLELISENLPVAETLTLENQTIADYISLHAAHNPNKIAIRYHNQELSFEALEKRSAAIAATLLDKGFKKGMVAGIIALPSIDLMAGVMAIMKAGGAFFPLHTDNTINQNTKLLQQANADFLLLSGINEAYSVKNQISITDINFETNKSYTFPKPSLQDTAYIIATSGTTGTPKLIEVTHKNLINYTTWFKASARLKSSDQLILTTSIAFDLGYTAVFPSLMAGAALHLVSGETYSDPSLLLPYLIDNNINIIKLTPSLFSVMKDNPRFDEYIQNTLRLLVLGGEKIRVNDIKNLQDKNNELVIVNHYGPAETTIGTLSKWVTKNKMQDFVLNPVIGSPIANAGACIVGKDGQLVPDGYYGELCIYGEGVSKGYLQKAQTQKAFQDINENIVLYHTGDSARKNSNGEFEFAGRIDKQFKIRGFRVEPVEIENALLSHPTITAAVVVGKEESLLGYVVSNEALNIEEIKTFLNELLPAYKVPSLILQIAAIPLTKNNKIDYKALPDINTATAFSDYDKLNTIERALVKIWSELLNLDRTAIGRSSDFFELGGHSLNCIQLSSRILKEFQVSVSVKEIFTHPVLSALASLIKSREKGGYAIIPVAREKENYPLSSAQNRFFILQQLHEYSTAYNMYWVYKMKTEITPLEIERAFKKLIERYEGLRTSLHINDGETFQTIHNEVAFNVEIKFVSGDNLVSEIYKFIRPFNLAKAPLARLGYFKARFEHTEENYVIVDMHHSISDGISNDLLMRDFQYILNNQPLPQIPLQYKDYAEWKREYKNTTSYVHQKEYWLKRFAGEIPMLDLPIDYERPAVKDFSGDTVSFEINAEKTKALRSLARNNGVTLFMVFLSIYKILLSKLSNQEDLVVGIPVSGRNREELQFIFGCFINSLAIRSNPVTNLPYTAYLTTLKSDLLDAYDHQEYPFEELIEQLHSTRNTSRNPLFDVMFDYHNEKDMALELNVFDDDTAIFTRKTAMFDLNLHTVETSSRLFCELEFSTKLFKRTTAERFAVYFQTLVDAILKTPEAKLHQLDIIPLSERTTIVDVFNDTKAAYSEDKYMHEMFEEAALLYPNRVAATINNQAITYCELQERVSQLAARLQADGLRKGTYVSITMNRSLEMITAVLAVLKAGGVYVPLEPFLPCSRVAGILERLDCAYTIITQDQLDKLKEIQKDYSGLKYVYVTDDFSEENLATDINLAQNTKIINALEIKKCTARPMAQNISTDDLAYIIYTSGTTGKPKGVVVQHKPAVNLIEWVNNTFKIDQHERLLFVTSLGFDLSVYDIFGTLAAGGTVCMASSSDVKNAEKLLRLISKYKITFWDSAPAAFQQMVPLIPSTNDLHKHSLKRVFFSGDWIPLPLPVTIKNTFTNAQVISLGGATEATIWSNFYPIDQIHKDWKSIPYGRPIQNARYYILNEQLDICALGVPGDLYIGGECLALGYFGDEKLTQSRFLPDPFVENGTMYKTGDLAKWNTEGVMELLGRKDFQVKVRGHRIELGEIENQLLAMPEIKQVIIVARGERTDKYLCAYYTAEKELEIASIKKHLSKELPEYMIPAHFMKLTEMPVNANGKIDRKALPEIGQYIEKEIRPARNAQDNLLIDIWSELLEIDKTKLGIDDDFFELGGHSLKASYLISEIYKHTGIKVPLTKIFLNPTIADISDYLQNLTKDTYKAIPQTTKSTEYPVTSAQKRLYFLQQMNTSSVAYNITQVFKLQGNVEYNRLLKAIQELTARHESLRTNFVLKEGIPVQKIRNIETIPVQKLTYEGDGLSTFIQNQVTAFNLETETLARVFFITIEKEAPVLVFDIHHSIADGISLDILFKELLALYEGKALPALSLQFKDYAVWQQQNIQQAQWDDKRNYWLQSLANTVEPLNLPLDYKRPEVKSFNGDKLFFEISEALTTTLREKARNADMTLFSYLLATYAVFLSKLTQQKAVTIGTPVSGRERSELKELIGLFVNTLAIRLQLSPSETVETNYQTAKETIWQALEHQDYPFEDLIDNLALEKSLAKDAIFDTMFVFEGNEGSQVEDISEDLEIIPLDYTNKISKFDLTLYISDQNEKLYCNFEFCTDIFSTATINSFVSYFQHLLHDICGNPQKTLLEVELLSQTHKNVLEKLAVPSKDQHKISYQTPIGRFGVMAKKYPQRNAIVFKEISLSYRQLDEYATKLARHLIDKGIEKQSVVAVLLQPGVEMFIAMLAIWKANCIYLPLSTKQPEERIKYMLNDSEAVQLISSKSLMDEQNIEGINLSIDLLNTLTLKNTPAFSTRETEALAYIIYTSGTTGLPKGTKVTNHSLTNSIQGFEDRIYGKYHDALTIALTAAYEFDGSMHVILGALLLGNTLCIIAEEERLAMDMFYQRLLDNKVDVIEGTPTYLKLLAEGIGNKFAQTTVKHIISGGELLPVSLIDKLKSAFGENQTRLKITNIYGPTETCIGSTSYEVDEHTNLNEFTAVPIGKPMLNEEVWLLDSSLKLVPHGVAGEICIGGIGVASGYLNQEKLNEEKFITHPFKPTGRLYKTGDLAKWLPDGNLQYLGRKDNQLKIRGYRIETDEIKAIVESNENVTSAEIVLIKDANEHDILVCFIVSASPLKELELINYLSEKLPSYMVPSRFIKIDKIPLTSNGKTDFKKLKQRIPTTSPENLPQQVFNNSITQNLFELWMEVLNLGDKKIYAGTDFFEVGGHSLKAMTLSGLIAKFFNVEFNLMDVFRFPTLQAQTTRILHAKEKISIETLAKTLTASSYPLSAQQNRLYFIQKLEPKSVLYNLTQSFELTGKVDIERMNSTFNALIERHEILRTALRIIGDEPRQVVLDAVPFQIEYFADSFGTVEDRINNAVTAFNLSKPPLLRVQLYKITEVKFHIIIDLHHIVTDGYSMQMLISEFNQLYNSEELSPVYLQYKDYAAWQQSKAFKKSMVNQEQFWVNEFDEIPELLSLPSNSKNKENNAIGSRVEVALDEEMTIKLKEFNSQNGSTMYMTLLSAYAVLLNKFSGLNDFVIGTPAIGRSNHELNSIMGMMTNLLPLRIQTNNYWSFTQFLKNVKEKTLSAMVNQDYPFNELITKLGLKRNSALNPLCNIQFSYDNFDEHIIKTNALNWQPTQTEKFKLQFEFSLYASIVDGSVTLIFEYPGSKIHRHKIEKLAESYLKILEHIAIYQDLLLENVHNVPTIVKHHAVNTFDTEVDFNF